MIENVADGDLHEDVSDATHKLLVQLREMANLTGQAASGSLTLKIDFTVDLKGNVEIEGGITSKSPSAPKKRASLWLTPGSNVAFEPPSRQRGPVREVARTNEPPREAGVKRSNEDGN